MIVTTEEIVDEGRIRSEPCRTVIPFYVVDAVCEVPFGAHPTQMPYLYFFDEEHIGEWMHCSRTPEGAEKYFQQYVYGVDSFESYLQLAGGTDRLRYLRRVERLEAQMRAPWLKVKGA